MINEILKEALNKYKIKDEDFFRNYLNSIELKTENYSGLTERETKSLYKDLSKNYSKSHKTIDKNIFLKSIKVYHEFKLKDEVIYKTEEPEVNQVLEGGFKGGYIYKLIGPTETGKTTLINSLVRANINNNTKILFFSFIDDNIDYDLLNNIKTSSNKNITIVDNIKTFYELLLSEYFKNKGEKLKNYNLVIFDPFTIILYKGVSVDNSLLNDFNEILNNLSWKYNICFVFSIYARKLSNTFWYAKNDQGNIERIILRNYDNLDILPKLSNNIKIYLYKMRKHNIVKYYMRVTSPCLNKITNFIEWELNS